ncbi:MAG TPA: DUF3857 domain-containing protein [Paludibacter sp.]|nr:DUF3857 domain-containing protein [Paludibacter sp.]
MYKKFLPPSFLLLLASVMFIGSNPATAQRIAPVFGQINKNEILYQECDFDKGAEAVVLFDIGDSHFVENVIDSRFVSDFPDFNVLFKRHTRIKILKPGGEKYAVVEIPLYTSDNTIEKVENIQITTHNIINNEIISTPIEDIKFRKEKINKNWEVKKFVIPDVKPGTIIEYEYSVNSNYLTSLHDWKFQKDIPVVYSQYTVALIPYFEYNFLLQGIDKFDSKYTEQDPTENTWKGRNYHNMLYTFIMKDLPGFNGEEYITSKEDYIMKMNLQLARILYLNGGKKNFLSTWGEIKDLLLKHENFGLYMNKAKEISIPELNPESMANFSDQQKFDTIMNYVKSHFKWNKATSILTSKGASKVFSDKYGNSAELNLLCIGLLNKYGISAVPLVSSTKENGLIHMEFPLLNDLNNVLILAKVDSANIVTDATNPLILNNRIPLNCINDKAIVVDNNEQVKTVELYYASPVTHLVEINSEINNDKTTSQVTHRFAEYEAMEKQRTFGKDVASLLKSINKAGYEIDNKSLVIKNMNKAQDEYSYSFQTNVKTEAIDNKLYVQPTLSECLNVNPLKQKVWRYPIDMSYSNKTDYSCHLKIPAGYIVTHLPENTIINDEKFQLSYTTTTKGNEIDVHFSYWFKKPIYNASDYETIKSAFQYIIDFGKERIELQRQ